MAMRFLSEIRLDLNNVGCSSNIIPITIWNYNDFRWFIKGQLFIMLCIIKDEMHHMCKSVFESTIFPSLASHCIPNSSNVLAQDIILYVSLDSDCMYSTINWI